MVVGMHGSNPDGGSAWGLHLGEASLIFELAKSGSSRVRPMDLDTDWTVKILIFCWWIESIILRNSALSKSSQLVLVTLSTASVG